MLIDVASGASHSYSVKIMLHGKHFFFFWWNLRFNTECVSGDAKYFFKVMMESSLQQRKKTANRIV